VRSTDEARYRPDTATCPLAGWSTDGDPTDRRCDGTAPPRRRRRPRRRGSARRGGGRARRQPDAFRVLVERESRPVVRTCYRVLGDLHEARTRPEAFVTAYRALATWRGEGPFGAWLARIAVRIAVRRAGRRRSVAWIDPAPFSTAAARRPAASPRRHSRGPLGARPILPSSRCGRSGRRPSARRWPVSTTRTRGRALRFFSDLSLAEIASASGRPSARSDAPAPGLARLRRDSKRGEPSDGRRPLPPRRSSPGRPTSRRTATGRVRRRACSPRRVHSSGWPPRTTSARWPGSRTG